MDPFDRKKKRTKMRGTEKKTGNNGAAGSERKVLTSQVSAVSR